MNPGLNIQQKKQGNFPFSLIFRQRIKGYGCVSDIPCQMTSTVPFGRHLYSFIPSPTLYPLPPYPLPFYPLPFYPLPSKKYSSVLLFILFLVYYLERRLLKDCISAFMCPLCKEGNARFTTVPLQRSTEIRVCKFIEIRLYSAKNSSVSYVQFELNTAHLEFVAK